MVDQRSFFVNIDDSALYDTFDQILSLRDFVPLWDWQGKSPNLSMSLRTHYDDTTTQNQGREDHKESHNDSKVETGMWCFILCRSYSCAVVCRLSTPAANKSVHRSCELHFSLSYSWSSWWLPKWYEVRLLWASDLYKVRISFTFLFSIELTIAEMVWGSTSLSFWFIQGSNFIHFPMLDRVDNCRIGMRFDFSELLIYTRF
jgi:hypothetical protein